jgi:hypothetical protein
VPPVDRVRNWGRKAWANPWLLVGIVAGLLLVGAWIGWAVSVWSEHGARQGIGVLIVWPAILAALAVISIPFVWAFRVIRASAGSDGEDPEPIANEPEKSDDSGDDQGSEPEPEAAPN